MKKKRKSLDVDKTENELVSATYLTKEQEQENNQSKRIKSRQVWRNLDLILSLQSKEFQLQQKIQVAFDFICSKEDDNCPDHDVVPLPRLVVFMNDWIQSILISSDKKEIADTGFVDLSLDFKCWEIFKFCLKRCSKAATPLSFSPNLFRVITRVVTEFSSMVASVLPGKEPPFIGDRFQLCSSFSDCISLLFSHHGRVFHSSVDMWVSLSSSTLDVICKIFSTNFTEHKIDIIVHVCSHILESFANYLRIHPNPRNTFPVIIDRLLEQLSSSLVFLCSFNEEKLVKNIEDIIIHGVFHYSHIGGFLSLGSSEKYRSMEGSKESRPLIKSYHRQLFKKLEQFTIEKNKCAMWGIGHLLHLFITKVKGQNLFRETGEVKNDSKISTVEGNSNSEGILSFHKPIGDMNKSIFNLFKQMLDPLIIEVKHFSEPKEEFTEQSLSGSHITLTAINKVLYSFMHERIYSRTEDTSKESHFNFLKEVFDMVISFSMKVHLLCLSIIKSEDRKQLEMLYALVKEIVISMSHFLEIEHKIIGDDLQNLWMLMLFYVSFDLSLENGKFRCSVVSEIIQVACQLVKIYSELRQVDKVIFALSKVVRLFGCSDKLGFCFYPYETCVQSMLTLLCSQEFRLSCSAAISTVPEGQVSGFIQQLNTDMVESLNWLNFTSLSYENNLNGVANQYRSLISLQLEAELLGRGLCELYAIVLDFSTVTAGNSIHVGNSVKGLVSCLCPGMSALIQSQSDCIDKFLYSVIGNRLANHTESESHKVEQQVKAHISWILLLFLRTFLSCKSLYHQSISLMPPNASRKGSAIIGDVFTAYSGNDWLHRTEWEDQGYFSWIAKSSSSLLHIIHSIEEILLPGKHASVVYTLHSMVLQKLIELKRQIKCFEFLQEKDQRLSLITSEVGSFKEMKKRNECILQLRKEASDLAGFLMNCIAQVDENKILDTKEEVEWDLGVCSISEKTLPVALWYLLCRSTDIWSMHVSKRCMRKFLLMLMCYSLFGVTNLNEVGHQRKVDLRHISQELLSETVLYDQTLLYRNMGPKFYRSVMKTFLPSLGPYISTDFKINCLPDWSTLLRNMRKKADNHTIFEACRVKSGSKSSHSMSVELKTGQYLLNMFAHMPKKHIRPRSFSAYATFILNMERLIVPNLVSSSFCNSSYLSVHFEMCQLFVSCRRALKHLLLSLCDEKLMTEKSPIILCASVFSVLWFFKTVSKTIHLSPSYDGTEYEVQFKDMVFSLINHTSYTIFAITESQMRTASMKKSCIESYECGKQFYPFHIVKHMAETIREQTESLLGMLRDENLMVKDELIIWNKLSLMLSCLQGFLWGLVSAMEDIEDRLCGASKIESPEWKSSLLLELKHSINVFDDFVFFCSKRLATNICELDHCEDKEGVSKLEFELKCSEESDMSSVEEKNKVTIVDGNEDHSMRTHDNNGRGTSLEVNNSTTSGIQRMRSRQYHGNIIDILPNVSAIDLFEQHLNKPLLQKLFKRENPEVSFFVRQLFMTAAAFLRLKTLAFQKLSEKQVCDIKFLRNSTLVLMGTVDFILSEFMEMAESPCPSSFYLLDGVLKYLESLSSQFLLMDPLLSREIYSKLVGLHLKVIGKCITFQGKKAILSSHEMESTTKIMDPQTQTHVDKEQPSEYLENSLWQFKARTRDSFKMYIKNSTELLLLSAIQVLERALVGIQEIFSTVYEIKTGCPDGGKVSSIVAGGIDCFDLILEHVSGRKCLNLVKRHVQGLIGALFNIISHLRSPLIFLCNILSHDTRQLIPDSGAVVLMCVEVITRVARRHSIFQMDPYIVAQCFHLPTSLFNDFLHLKLSQSSPCSMIDHQFSINLFVACCRLLCTVLRHRKSESKQCTALLQDSVCTLLYCLEMVGISSSKKGYFLWELDEGITCANFFRRIYEEIRHQKDILGKHSYLFLSQYIWIYSGNGPLKRGLKREIDEVLRPGVYALIDLCSPESLQKLHVVLGEGPCRTTLANLRHDYKLNFQYEGKV